MLFRRWIAAIAAVALASLPVAAAAHSDLVSTTPEAGANLDEAATEVVMTFESELQADGSGFVVTDDDGAEVGTGSLDLQVAERNELRGAVEIDEPGVYTVTWTSVAADGFETGGEFAFGYRAEPPAPEEHDDHGEAPDTAMPVPQQGPDPLVIVGAGLVLVAVLIVARRAVLR